MTKSEYDQLTPQQRNDRHNKERITSTVDHNTHLDQNGYTDVDSGEFISLRDTDGLSTGVTGIDGSGDVTVYNHATNKHHRVLKGSGNESDSQRFIDDHKRQLNQTIYTDNSPAPSVTELAQQVLNKQRREKEAEEGHYGNHSSGVNLG